VYVVSGAAGNGESIDKFTGEGYGWTFSAFRSLDIGYNRMMLHNATHLEIDFYSVSKQAVIDRFWIAKEAPSL
jgi:hypothetical protein